jgi:hypothetical protein
MASCPRWTCRDGLSQPRSGAGSAAPTSLRFLSPEQERRPGCIDRADLVVDPSGGQRLLADDLLGQVVFRGRAALAPRDSELHLAHIPTQPLRPALKVGRSADEPDHKIPVAGQAACQPCAFGKRLQRRPEASHRPDERGARPGPDAQPLGEGLSGISSEHRVVNYGLGGGMGDRAAECWSDSAPIGERRIGKQPPHARLCRVGRRRRQAG